MKKTIVALAVLAASGASFAQVTVSGKLLMGYRSTTTGATAGNAVPESTSAGFGVDTSEIDFVSVDDLGGGMKVIAKLAVGGADRSGESNTVTSGSVTGRDASLTLQTNSGLLVLGSTQIVDYLSSGVAGVGAYYQGFDSKIFIPKSNRDSLTYMLPLGAYVLMATYQEGGNFQGLGTGTAGPQTIGTTQALIGYVVKFNQDKLAVDAQYLSASARVDTSDSLIAGGAKDAFRLSGAYDFGSVKVGLGTQVVNYMTGAKQTDTLIGVSVPVGAFTVGAQWGSHNATDFSTVPALGRDVNGTRIGSEIQLNYALSKRTSIMGGYAQWEQKVGSSASSAFNLLLSHTF